MYLSAERFALANQAVRDTFAQCSIVWQAIPHWDVGDPGQLFVSDGILSPPGVVPLDFKDSKFVVTLAQANAPTPDALLTAVMAAATDLAKQVDGDVIPKLYGKATAITPPLTGTINPKDLQPPLLEARIDVENAGYRAPSCVITNSPGLLKLNEFISGYVNIAEQLMQVANVNALHRANDVDPPDPKTRLIFIGRRRRIPQGAAAEASPGEEPVDLAVSLMPSVEVAGETLNGAIELHARIRYALRVTDVTGVASIKHA